MIFFMPEDQILGRILPNHQRLREITADFLNAESPSEIGFYFSTTHALFTLAFAWPGGI